MISFCSALVWGASVKYSPQKVGKDHVLLDEDVVQIVKKWVAYNLSFYHKYTYYNKLPQGSHSQEILI